MIHLIVIKVLDNGSSIILFYKVIFLNISMAAIVYKLVSRMTGHQVQGKKYVYSNIE